MKITEVQKETMTEFLKKHPNLISGKFSANFTYKNAEMLWRELEKILNSIPGSRKDWKNWRKSWQDMRSRTKSKCASNSRNLNATGGGPSEEIVLTKNEESILDIIKVVSVEGHNVNESIVEFDMCEESAEEEIAPLHNNINNQNPPSPQIPSCSYTIPEQSTSTGNYSSPSAQILAQKRKLTEQSNFTPRKIPKRTPGKFAQAAVDSYKESLDRKNQIKENYYKEKLEILRTIAAEKAKCSAALERIADTLENLI